MSEKKNFFKVRRTRVWFITTASIAALAITVNVLATRPQKRMRRQTPNP
jgi:hypothetical protein